MMRNNAVRFLFLGLLCLFSGAANATCSAVPFSFSAGATIASAQVNSNFAALVSCINSVDAAQITTGVLPVARGGTGANTSTGSGSVMLAASPTTTGTLTVGAINASGIITTSAQANIFGSASGDRVSPTSANTNLLLYKISSSNYAGFGASGDGSIYAVTGLSAPATRMVIDTVGNLQLSGNVGVAGAGAPVGLVNLAIVGNSTGIQGGASAMNLIAGGVTRLSIGTNVSAIGDLNVTGGGYVLNGTPGVNCSGAPTGGFTVSKGIVTVC